MAKFIELTEIEILDTPYALEVKKKVKVNVDNIVFYKGCEVFLKDGTSLVVDEEYDQITKLIEEPIAIEDIQQAANNLVNNEWRERKEHLLDMIRKQTLAVVINKACTWLERNLVHYWYDVEGFLNEEGLLEDFKKALLTTNEEET
jgi:hypothetical protein